MAGDWIKMELGLPDKPEVWRIAGILSIEPDAVVGKLLRVWGWFDLHTEDGNAHGVTFPLLDRVTGVAGFAEAMSLCGWLVQNGHTMSIPNFGRHNGKTAKNRALTSERVAKHRAAGNAASNVESATKTVTREEKRRRVKSEPVGSAFLSQKELEAEGVAAQVAADWLTLRKAKRLPLTPTAWNDTKAEGLKAGLSPAETVAAAVSHNWAGFRAAWYAKEPAKINGRRDIFAGLEK